jgi:flagellar L-ring protein precursor FlgH
MLPMQHLLLTMLGMAVLTGASSAQSLWDKRHPTKAFLFHDTQASRVGDLLTIVISEDTDVNNEESRSLGKETEAGSQFNLAHAAAGVFGNSSGKLTESGSLTSDRSFDGNAKFSSARDFTDRLTATVVDVLPNRSMVILGRRHVDVAGDRRCLVFSGIVRYEDISADNSVLSRHVSNQEMRYDDAGPESHFTKQGWLGKTTNWLWPF